MKFLFEQGGGDPLAKRINLRQIDKTTPHWDHPMKGLFQYANELSKYQGDILKLPKVWREKYAICLTSLAMMKDTGADWWTSFPGVEAPDGFIMTLSEDQAGRYFGHMRGIEVVENRNSAAELAQELKRKMTEKSYDEDYVLVCLVLTPALFDFAALAESLRTIPSKTRHVFAIFPGVHLSQIQSIDAQVVQSTFTLVQLLPRYDFLSFSLEPFMKDFENRYELGQESRMISEGKLYFATNNPVHASNVLAGKCLENSLE